MIMKMIIRIIAIWCVLLGGIAGVDGLFSGRIFIKEAQARVGKPGRPGVPGVHGGAAVVAHRTTRRVIRRTAIFVAVLPDGCQNVVIEGTTLQQCGGTYYQSSGNQYVVVEID
jgi:hypothetical protein